MVRRYYRRLPHNNRDKYSVEQTFINPPSTSNWFDVAGEGTIRIRTRQFTIPVINPSTDQGMRKVKHFTLTFNGIPDAMAYALVYVPDGYTPNYIKFPGEGYAISMYEPNQFVISQGVLDPSAGPVRIRSPLSRNLNSNDTIYLVLAIPYTEEATNSLLATVKYAITLQ